MTLARRREAVAFYLTISPWLIGFLLLTVGPMLYSLYISFTRWDLLTEPIWIGLDNYLTKDAQRCPLLAVAEGDRHLHGRLRAARAGWAGWCWRLLVRNQIRGVRFFRTIFYLAHGAGRCRLCRRLAVDAQSARRAGEPGAGSGRHCWAALAA